MINKSIIERLDAIPMHEIFKLYGVPYIEGKNIRCPFPNHMATGKTPSFRVYNDASCACFGCRKGGGPIHFVMNMEGISYVEACDKLMSLYNIEKIPEFSYQKLADKNQKKEEMRDIKLKFGILSDMLSKVDVGSDEDLKKFSFLYTVVNSVSGTELLNLSLDMLSLSLQEFVAKIPDFVKNNQKVGLAVLKSLKRHDFERVRAFDPIQIHSGYFNEALSGITWPTQNDRYVFPIFLPGKVIAGFSGRTLKPNETLKYQTELMFKLSKKDLVYGLDVALPYIKEMGFCIIVEGILDAVRCWSVGYKNTVAPCCSYVSENLAILLKGITENFVLLQDNDYGGNEEALLSEKYLEKHNLSSRRLMLPENEDPDSYGLKNPRGLAEMIKNGFS